jgi:hypothetical protein
MRSLLGIAIYYKPRKEYLRLSPSKFLLKDIFQRRKDKNYKNKELNKSKD